MTGRSPVCWSESYRAWVVVVWEEIEDWPFICTNRETAEFFSANGYIPNW
jgi:hypothetical protein